MGDGPGSPGLNSVGPRGVRAVLISACSPTPLAPATSSPPVQRLPPSGEALRSLFPLPAFYQPLGWLSALLDHPIVTAPVCLLCYCASFGRTGTFAVVILRCFLVLEKNNFSIVHLLITDSPISLIS